MAKQTKTLIFFIVSITLTLFFITNSTAKETVYDLLPKYGLPSGLLPNTVTDYTLSDDGRFIVGIINKKLNVNQFKTVHSCRNSLGSSPCSSISSLV
ncbi:hypothetical protein TSUD_68190 [Trifolium subterraneum]|uniref:Uncharacterized protein n=1 Tax=Trifolium subterraneum TaxID=3900 RepID=A0A2Z6MJ89_TRISU|nr:hypothetical protein TSUD_68190 [Trifolium subterraneum]